LLVFCGCIWLVEAMCGGFDKCYFGILFDVMLTLYVIQLLFLCCLFIICCASVCLVCCRIVQIFIQISNEQPDGFMGMLHAGATKDSIQKFTQLKKFTSDLMEESNAICPICLEDYVQDDEIRYLPCSELHHFHKSCIDQWLEQRKSCPLCKVNIDFSNPEINKEEEIVIEEDNEETSI